MQPREIGSGASDECVQNPQYFQPKPLGCNLRFRQMHNPEKFESIHPSFQNNFNSQRCICKRIKSEIGNQATLSDLRSIITL